MSKSLVLRKNFSGDFSNKDIGMNSQTGPHDGKMRVRFDNEKYFSVKADHITSGAKLTNAQSGELKAICSTIENNLVGTAGDTQSSKAKDNFRAMVAALQNALKPLENSGFDVNIEYIEKSGEGPAKGRSGCVLGFAIDVTQKGQLKSLILESILYGPLGGFIHSKTDLMSTFKAKKFEPSQLYDIVSGIANKALRFHFVKTKIDDAMIEINHPLVPIQEGRRDGLFKTLKVVFDELFNTNEHLKGLSASLEESIGPVALNITRDLPSGGKNSLRWSINKSNLLGYNGLQLNGTIGNEKFKQFNVISGEEIISAIEKICDSIPQNESGKKSSTPQ